MTVVYHGTLQQSELILSSKLAASAAKKFGVSTSQVSRLVKAKQQIFDQFDTGNHNRKRQRAGKEEEVGSALFLWFQQKISQGARLSGPLLKQKATELAAAEGSEFTPSDGWLSRWKSRHNIAYKKEQGEKQNADFPAAQHWRQHIIPAILQAYNKDDIFNADETGLYYRGLPDKGHCLKGDELVGGKKAMERITTLVCANMSGTEKRPLFIIGKSRQPRCFPRDPSGFQSTTVIPKMLG
ncbi:tigger transposable element-derived protein 4-like [Ptychodera flava]|uniref:tigger transposable element-derived protein 4-like n=1 Tax=Ptychodera flava TaxID=63121 RepID=UPI00396A5593